MDGMLIVILTTAAFLIALPLYRWHMYRLDGARRWHGRQAWREQRDAKKRAANEAEAVRKIEQTFPFIKEAVRQRVAAGVAPVDAARAVLREVQGTVIGTARPGGFRVVIPTSVRRTHIATWGRTGAGKTTLGMHLLNDDLVAGHGLVVIGSEREAFRDHILPRIPKDRDIVYFAPGDESCPLAWNPLSLEAGEDPDRAAGELFSIFRRALDQQSLGPRSDSIARNAFSVMAARKGSTFLSIRPLLEDQAYRERVLAELHDAHCRAFWQYTYPAYPRNAYLPLINRVERFIAPTALRRAICQPESSFSVSEALEQKKVLLFDLSGLDPDATYLLGQMLLSKLQLEIMRRERVPEADRPLTLVFCDEFHEFAGTAEGTWRQLLAKGRRYGLGLNLFTQHPNQLSRSLQDEILGNVSTLFCLGLSAKDAARLRKELLTLMPDGSRAPVPAENLVSLTTGQAWARIGSGSCAVRVDIKAPLQQRPRALGTRVRDVSWRRYGEQRPPAQDSEVAVVRLTGDRSTRAVVPPAELPGRGGHQHRMLQDLIRRWGQERGFRATIEETILGGAGRVDVVLTRGEHRIAVEVAVTSRVDHIVDAVVKAIANGFNAVVVVTSDVALRYEMDGKIQNSLTAAYRPKVKLLLPDEVCTYLDETAAATPTVQNGDVGYRVKVTWQRTSDEPERRHVRELLATAGAAEGLQ